MTQETDPVEEALTVFREALDSAELEARLGITPQKARALMQQVRKRLVRDRLNEGAALEFAAETAEIWGSLERKAVAQILSYNGGVDKLAGLAAMLRVVKELRSQQVQLFQELGLLPNRGKSGNLPDPAPLPPRESNADDLRAGIEALQQELLRVEGAPSTAAPTARPQLPPGRRK